MRPAKLMLKSRGDRPGASAKAAGHYHDLLIAAKRTG